MQLKKGPEWIEELIFMLISLFSFLVNICTHIDDGNYDQFTSFSLRHETQRV